MSLLLEDDHHCFACGSLNERGLRLIFEHPAKGRLKSRVTFQKHHQGFKNMVHGGLIATVLDEMMVNLAWKEGIPAVTAEITVRLKKPVFVGVEVFLEGELRELNEKSRAFKAEARLLSAQNELLASATAVCVRVKS